MKTKTLCVSLGSTLLALGLVACDDPAARDDHIEPCDEGDVDAGPDSGGSCPEYNPFEPEPVHEDCNTMGDISQTSSTSGIDEESEEEEEYLGSAVHGANGEQLVAPASAVAGRWVCSVGSHPAWGGIRRTWPARTFIGRNLVGGTLVDLALSEKVSTINCNITAGPAGQQFCTSTGQALTNGPTHGFGYIGWTAGAADGSASHVAQDPVNPTVSRAKVVNEGNSNYQFWASTDVSVMIADAGGFGVKLEWTGGGAMINGGTLDDTCAWNWLP